LGKVVASGYTSFSFRSGEAVPSGTLVEARGGGFAVVGRVVEAAADPDGGFTYTVSVYGPVPRQGDPVAAARRAVPVRAGRAGCRASRFLPPPNNPRRGHNRIGATAPSSAVVSDVRQVPDPAQQSFPPITSLETS